MNAITDQAVAAAADIIRKVDYPDYTPDVALARKVLEAAAPHMLAEAWEEGVGYSWQHETPSTDENPYRSRP